MEWPKGLCRFIKYLDKATEMAREADSSMHPEHDFAALRKQAQRPLSKLATMEHLEFDSEVDSSLERISRTLLLDHV